MKIVSTGSLGHIGLPLTKKLVADGHTVTVVSSSEQRRRPIEALGAMAAIGSLQDVDFLTETLAGADLLYGMVPPDYSQPDYISFYQELGRNYVQAIQQTNTRRAIFLSTYGAELAEGNGILRGAYLLEREVDRLRNTDVTLIRPTYFYYNLLGLIGTIRASGDIMANFGGPQAFALVAPEDIATAIADEVATEGHHHRVRYVYSDERTGDEVAAVLGRAIGRPDLQWMVISDEAMQQGLRQAGLSIEFAAGLTEMYRALREGRLSRGFDAHRPASPGSITLEDYVPAFAAAFAARSTPS